MMGGPVLNYPPLAVEDSQSQTWNAEIHGHILHLSDILLDPEWY